jgi:hypothetical protein
MILNTIWRASKRAGFVWTCVVAVALPLLEAAVVIGLGAEISAHPKLALAALIPVFIFAACTGLISFWLITAHVEFHRRGYRVTWLEGNYWLYEERYPDDIGQLRCVRIILGRGYPAPSKIILPNQESWNAVVPIWAHDRRSEIMRRVGRCFGADRGAYITFS